MSDNQISMHTFSLPFRLEQNLMLLTALSEAGLLQLTLDTCAWPHVVRTGLAQAQAWLTGGEQMSEGVAGQHASLEAHIPCLQLGPLALKQLDCLCDPLNGPVPIDLMLGAPLLADWVIEVDYLRGLLTLTDPAHWQCPEAAPHRRCLPLAVLEPGLPVLREQLRINNQVVPVALLDTGNNACLVLSADLAQSLGLQAETEVAGGGFGGQSLSFGSLTLARVQLGPLGLESVPAVILPPQASPLLAAPGTALIGNGLLQKGRATWALAAGCWLFEIPESTGENSK